MRVSEAVIARRSHKQFDANHQMTQAEIQQLMELAILTPTAFNIQNWRFVRVQDQELRNQMRQAAWDQPQITDSSLLLVLCMDIKAWDRQPERYWRNTDTDTQNMMVSSIRDFYRDDHEAQRDEGMRSCSMAAMNLMLVAKEMGYDSCPMDGFDFKRVGHLIQLPKDHAICMIVAIGKALEEPYPRSGPLPLTDVFFNDHF